MTYIGSKFENSDLVPRDGLTHFYLADAEDSGSSAKDLVGTLNLSAAATAPTRTSDAAGVACFQFDGSAKPLISSSSPAIVSKTIAVLCTATDATFNDYRGLFTGTDAAFAPALLSNNTGTLFFNSSIGLSYYKNFRLFAESNMVAPVSDTRSLVLIELAAGIAHNGIQIGQDRTFTTRLWKGKVYFVMTWSKVLNTAEKLNLQRFAAAFGRTWPENSSGVKVFPFPTDWSRPAARSKSVLSSVSVSQKIKQRSKTNTARRSYDLGFADRTTPEFDAAAQFHDEIHGNSSFIFRDYTRDPTEDREAYIMTPIEEEPGGYNRRSYRFSIIEK